MGLRAAPLIVFTFALYIGGCAAERTADKLEPELSRVLDAAHRTAEHRARDAYRHPRETLEFFGLGPEMTVVEVWPGAGWYTEILAPLLAGRGKLYVAHFDPGTSDYARTTSEGFRSKLAARPDLYRTVTLTTLAAPPAANEIAPPGSADLVLTFRNLHNWMMFGWEREAVRAMHAALKPGGILGIVEHRAAPGRAQDPRAASGYVDEQYAIELIEAAGFELAGRSEINANSRDTRDYEHGVWALPPTYAAGPGGRERYAAIGESDRFTLKFVKTAR